MNLSYKVGEVVFKEPSIAHLFFWVIIFFGFSLPGVFLYGIAAYQLEPREENIDQEYLETIKSHEVPLLIDTDLSHIGLCKI